MKTTIKNGLVITFINEGYHSIKMKYADLLIEDGIFAKISECLPDEGEVIDTSGKWILPGLINVGSSIATSVLTQGLIPDYKRHNWQGSLVYSRVNPIMDLAEDLLDEDEKYTVMKYGMLRALSSGSTYIVDMNRPSFVKAADKASKELEIRSKIISMNTSGLFPKASHEGLLSCEYPKGGALRSEPNSIPGLYSIETTSDELWDQVRTFDNNDPLVLFGAYSNYEKHVSWTRYGKSPIAKINDSEALSEKTVLLQSLFTDFFDRERLRTAGSSVSLCASDSIHDGIHPPIVDFLKQDINTSICTGITGHSMLEEMKLAAFGSKLDAGSASQFQASDAFYAASVAGSRAIGEPDTGRIDIGFQGDLLIIDPKRFAPTNYPLISLIYAGDSRDIEKVVVGGKTVFDYDTHSDEITMLGMKVQKIAEKIWASARKNII
jgi:cytosine/adenosine deaminase-related metal-dependent hydrolase